MYVVDRICETSVCSRCRTDLKFTVCKRNVYGIQKTISRGYMLCKVGPIHITSALIIMWSQLRLAPTTRLHLCSQLPRPLLLLVLPLLVGPRGQLARQLNVAEQLLALLHRLSLVGMYGIAMAVRVVSILYTFGQDYSYLPSLEQVHPGLQLLLPLSKDLTQ